jgi:hypothetical protein
MIASTILQTIATAAKPWASLYSNSTAVDAAVTFGHIIGTLFAGGIAISADRATFKALRGTDEDRTRLLIDLGNTHAWVITGLTLIFISGLLQALSDVKTFGVSIVFWTKMALVALLLVNGAVLQRTERTLRAGSNTTQGAASMKTLWRRLGFAAGASITLWTAIVLAGVILQTS